PGGGPRVCEGTVDARFDLYDDPPHLVLTHQALGLLERAAGLPRSDLLERPVSEVVVLVDPTVLEDAIRLELQERRPIATARPGDSLLGFAVDGRDVVPVGAPPRHAETLGVPIDLGLGLPVLDMGVRRVEVVLADEDDGQLAQR